MHSTTTVMPSRNKLMAQSTVKLKMFYDISQQHKQHNNAS